MALSDEQKLALARRFLSVLGKPGAKAIKETATPDVVWSFPGKGMIAGEAVGVKAIIARAKIIASFRLTVDVVRAVYSQDGIALILHNTATHGKIMFDEHIAAVFIFRGDKIVALDTHLSDVAMADAFFVKENIPS
jgi:ketosteroid isomerase-like protein